MILGSDVIEWCSECHAAQAVGSMIVILPRQDEFDEQEMSLPMCLDCGDKIAEQNNITRTYGG